MSSSSSSSSSSSLRERYLSSSQTITQAESRETTKTRRVREINDEIEMIEKTNEKHIRNNFDDISIEDED
jgi:hypothetical protein